MCCLLLAAPAVRMRKFECLSSLLSCRKSVAIFMRYVAAFSSGDGRPVIRLLMTIGMTITITDDITQ